MIKNILEKIIGSEDLSQTQASEVCELIINGEISSVQAGALLTALRIKGETVSEIMGFIDTMESHMISVAINDANAIDMCGTGGDNSNTFNVSTTASLIVASGGVSVAKHGNRSISSKCGSADLLEALGVQISLDPNAVKKCIDEIGIGFFFAPLYHPAMKNIAPVRKSLEIRTIFNILGPLLNPAGVKRQLIGIFNPKTAKKIASVLSARNYKKACTVHSLDGFDEISPFSPTKIFEISSHMDGQIEYSFTPKFTHDQSGLNQITGKSCEENVSITKNVLEGKTGPARDMSVLNAAFGFYIGEKVSTVEEGISLAENQIDSGAVGQKLNEFQQMSNDLK
jgi:anthranilate phosphoribosyltransferase